MTDEPEKPPEQASDEPNSEPDEPFEPEPLDPRNLKDADWNYTHGDQARKAAEKAGHPMVLAGIGIALLGLLVFGAWKIFGGGPIAAPAPKDLPSFVIINSDDQRWDTLKYMPIVKKELADHGVTFTDAVVTNPVCCPSRASTLTGTYSHTNKVWDNKGADGGFRAFNDAGTIATYLNLDYETALFGKYLNNYFAAARRGYIPFGWDKWVAFDREGYANYRLNIDGTVQTYKEGPGTYSTTVLADQIVDYIGSTEGPLMIYFAPATPHYPAVAEEQDEDLYANLPNWRPRSYNEEDVSDKPDWVQRIPKIGGAFQGKVDEFRRDQLRSLVSLDRAVGRIVEALRATGRLENTMIVFTSDNGMAWGEHRYTGKNVAWEESIRVPMVVRYDAMLGGRPRTDDSLVANIDLTPTMVDLAGTKAPRADGESMVPLFLDANADWRDAILIEHWASLRTERIPSYCAIRTADEKYIDYYWGKDEFYDLAKDPFEMDNQIDNPKYRGDLARLAQDRRQLCNPGPPRSHMSLSDKVAVASDAPTDDAGPF